MTALPATIETNNLIIVGMWMLFCLGIIGFVVLGMYLDNKK